MTHKSAAFRVLLRNAFQEIKSVISYQIARKVKTSNKNVVCMIFIFRLLITYNYLTFVRAALLPKFTANASNFWSKPSPTVRVV